MNIFAKHIDLAKVLDVSVLSNRATARHVYESKIEKSWSPKIRLDFRGIDFASRSFLDELNHHLTEKKFTSFEKVNMNEQILKMDELVKSRKSSNKSQIKREDNKPEMLSI